MALIDDEVRASFPHMSDEEIEQFYGKGLLAREANQHIEITETDLGLAMIARELGWQALKEFIHKSIGDENISANDIVSIAYAANYQRQIEQANMYAAIAGFASEVTNKQTVNARKKQMRDLTARLDMFKILGI